MRDKMAIAADAIDWAALFADLETRGGVPGAASETMDAITATFRAMYLDLGAVRSKLAAADLEPGAVIICADVVNIPDGLNWLLRRTELLIVTRRLQVASRATINLDYRVGAMASLTLFTSEVAGALQVVAMTAPDGPQPAVYIIDAPPPAGGLRIHLRDGEPLKAPLDRSQGLPIQSTEFIEEALRTEFIFGSLLRHQRPALALAMFSWIKSWSGASPDLLDAFLRSASLVALLGAQVSEGRNGAALFPFLTEQAYPDLARAFVHEARRYESDYKALAAETVMTEDGLKLVRKLLDNQTDQSAYVGELRDQAKARYDNAVAAVDVARRDFDHAQLQAELTAIDFMDRGIPEWERQRFPEAVISLAQTAITFGVGIGSMLIGDGLVGAARAGAAVAGAKAVADAADPGGEIAELAKQLADSMVSLKKVVEGLQTIYHLSKEVVAAANDIGHAESYVEKMRRMDGATGGADLSATYQWRIYLWSADAALADPVARGVDYAEDLKLAMDAVAVYGQALAAAQLAAIKTGQDYAVVKLRQELAARQQKGLQQYVGALKQGEAPVVVMMQQFYQRYLDAQSSLFAAIEGDGAPFSYGALKPSASASKMIDLVGRIEADDVSGPPPQRLVAVKAVSAAQATPSFSVLPGDQAERVLQTS